MMETLQEFSTLPSNDPEYPEPWFCWKVFRPKNFIEWELDQFQVYDGKNIYSFGRIDPLAPQNFSKSGWIKYSQGHVETHPDSDTRTLLAMSARADCPCAEVIFMGYRRTNIEKFFDKHQQPRDTMQIIDSLAPDTFILESPKEDSAEVHRIHRTHVAIKPEPVCMRVETVVMNPTDGSSCFEDFTEVLDLVSFDGVFYPSKGRQFDANYSKCRYGRVFKYARMYEYEIESVERVPERSRETWVPDFPPGTSVSGIETRHIAHTREVRLQSFQNLIAHYSLPRWWQKMLAVIFGVSIKLVQPFFRFAAKRYSVKNGWIIYYTKPTKGAL
jgi:hypothetical protein